MENENITIMSPDYSRAVRLNKHIKIHAELAQQSLYEMCKGLKEMRDDKLYRELEYQNFEEYCEKEVGFTRWQAYKFISIVENLSKDFVDSSLQIGVTKLALLAKLDEPQREEIVQNVDLNNTSVKKLKEEIASLRAENEQKEQTIKVISEKNSELEDTLEEAMDTQASLVEQIESLEDTVQELESRPVEVAVADNSEEIQKLRDDNVREMFRMGKAHSDEIRKIKADYEQRISEMQENQADKSDVRAEINAYQKVAENSLHNLYAAICRQNEYGYGRLTTSIIEMLEEWKERFDDLGDENDQQNEN
ncbi:MAG: hypothetical protein K2I82_04435 [Ruminococcus sp.]|nr:hypothetical protein [Ruminococcus sp.]